MTRENDFRVWLEQGGAQTEKGRSARTYAIRTIEKNLGALGSPFQDLTAAWAADGFESLRSRLKQMRDDARAGGQDYRMLMPDSLNPHNRLANWGAWLSQYGRFLNGDPPGVAKIADRIRQYALEHYIEPARDEGRPQVDILVREVNAALKLNEAWPNICQALAGRMFQDLAQLGPPEQIGADQSSATVFRFSLEGRSKAQGDRPFVLFDAAGNAYRPVKHGDRATGVAAFHIKPRGASNRTADAIKTTDIVDVARAMLVDGLAARVQPFPRGDVNYLTYGNDKLVGYQLDPEIAGRIGVPARGGIEQPNPDVSLGDVPIEENSDMSPVNLILYGPPGTGKTYSTAAEAIRLCGEAVPDDRAELMDVYQKLVAAGRIEFVTFHQSTGYEEFIEGRFPMTGSDETEEASSFGFRLETLPGIFRRIAKRAETSRGGSSASGAITINGRDVFKMSIGEANNPEDAYLFEGAIEGGYVLLGWGETDWSDQKYASQAAILQACKDEKEEGETVDARSGRVQMSHTFRNKVKEGDIVVVSKGNLLFRAIGEVTGDYEFRPRAEPGYSHRRSVRWLWVDRSGVPVTEINARRFSQKSIYPLDPSDLSIPALERYMNSQRDDGPTVAEAFVLIIDEINRANISKVFGELITLLEPDKRLGQPNALKVRLPFSEEEFGVPSNLHVVGTMNTADRSIALLDTALRRRFHFREMMPDPSVLAAAAAASGLNLPRILSTINERIEYLYDREHQIGHAYFAGCATRADVDEVMRHKVIPLLAEYFFEDWSKIAAVLGDLQANDGPIAGGFLARTVLNPPPGLDDDDVQPRFRWTVRKPADGFDYTKLLGA